MADFPTLVPAFTAHLHPSTGLAIGSTERGGNLTIVPVESGSLKSEPGGPITLDAEVVYGSDYVRAEASQTHMRIDVRAVLKNSDGALISYTYKGVVAIDPEFMAIFLGSPEAKTTSYGNSITQVTFETGAEHLKDLEHGLFVGSAHFVVKEGGGYYIETKISQVKG